MTTITAMHDENRRKEILNSPNDMYYYAIYSEDSEERRFWLNEYIKSLHSATNFIKRIMDKTVDPE